MIQNRRSIGILLIIGVLFTSSVQCAKSKVQLTTEDTSSQWSGLCLDASAMQSPININGPFSYMSMDLDIVFRQIDSGQNYLQHVNNELVIKGDFGYVSQDSIIFSSYEVAFKSPSEHSVGTSQTFFPLEMQIRFASSTSTKLNMAFLFSFGGESDFLNRLGFGRGVLKNLLQNQNFQIPQAFNLQQVLPAKNKFFVYRGSETKSPCEPTIWLIGYDTLKLTQSQLNDFPRGLSYQGRDIQKKKQEIFINFNIEKEEEKKDEQELLGDIHTGDQNLHDLYNQQQVNELNKIKDSFILLGDTTIYDPFVYGHDSEPSAKFIKDTDYIVVQKEKPSFNKMKQNDEIEDIIFNKLKEDMQARKEKTDKKNETSEDDKESATPHEVEESNLDEEESSSQTFVAKKNSKKTKKIKSQKDEGNDKQEESENKESTKQEEADQSANPTVGTTKEEALGKKKVQKDKNIGPEYYAYNQDGEWDKVPIFSIDTWPKLCFKGKSQSPINIDPQNLMVQEDGEINVYYDQLNQHPSLFNDGIKLTLTGQFGTIEFQEHLYDASYVHIHFPSEHTFGADHKRADIEFQIEHSSLYGQKLMVSILGDLADHQTNPFLEAMGIPGVKQDTFSKIEDKLKLEEQIVSLDSLADSLENYYRYQGSLTHPPCTEDVMWLVSKDHVQFNKGQLENLRTLLGLKSNVRGTHNLYDRQIFVK